MSVPSECHSQVGNIFLHSTYLNNFLCTKSKQSRYTVTFLHLQGILLLTQTAGSNVSIVCRRLLQENSTPFRVNVRPSVKTVPVFGLRDGPLDFQWHSINRVQQNLYRMCFDISIFYEVMMCLLIWTCMRLWFIHWTKSKALLVLTQWFPEHDMPRVPKHVGTENVYRLYLLLMYKKLVR